MVVEGKPRAMLLEEFNEVMNRLGRMKDGFYAHQLDSVGLTLLQFTGLQAIHQMGPGISVGEIGEAIGAPPSTMTSLTNRLVALGLIERFTPPDNRRAVLVKTTESGATIVNDLICERDEDVQAIFEAMSDDKIIYLTDLLRSVAANFARRLDEKRAAGW